MTSQHSSNSQYYPEAVYGILYFALISTGDIADEDLSRFNVAINRMQLFAGLTNETADKYYERIEPHAESDWEKYLSSAAGILPGELKETAFAVSCDLVMRNGFVPPKANGYLEMLQGVLGIEDSLAEAIIYVIQIKNRG